MRLISRTLIRRCHKALACFYIPGAIKHDRWFPEDEGPNYTLAPTHKPLAHHRDQFSVLTNLLHIQGRISGHEHPYNWLTGTNIKITPGTITNTISMDQLAAEYFCARRSLRRTAALSFRWARRLDKLKRDSENPYEAPDNGERKPGQHGYWRLGLMICGFAFVVYSIVIAIVYKCIETYGGFTK